MVKNNALPKWVVDGIKNVKFAKPKIRKSSGNLLEIYADDLKVDVQLDDTVEDGRHIITMDLPKKVDLNALERGVTYEFSFEESKGKIDAKIIKYLKETKEVEMESLYQFIITDLTKVKTD